MSVMLICVSHNTIVSNMHEEQTRYYNVNFQYPPSHKPNAMDVDAITLTKLQWLKQLSQCLHVLH